MENINNILRDEQFVNLINKLSSLIYDYTKETIYNSEQIKNNFQAMGEEIIQIEEINDIINIVNLNEMNLNNFYSESKWIFKNLRMERKKYLQNFSNNIYYILSEEENGLNKKRSYSQMNMINRNKTINNSYYNKILNLIINLNKYSEIIGLYSEEDKKQYSDLINYIFQEINNNKNQISRSNNDNNNLDSVRSEKINEKYEKMVYDFNKYIKQLSKDCSELEKEVRTLSIYRNNNLKMYGSFNQSIDNNNIIKNNKIKQKQLLFSINKLKDEIKKERYNSYQKDQKIKQLKEINTKLYQEKKNEIKSLSENQNLRKLLFSEDNNRNIDLLNIIKTHNSYYNNSDNSTYFKSYYNYNDIDSLKKEINKLKKENHSLKEQNILKEKENNSLKEQFKQENNFNINKNNNNEDNEEKNDILKMNEELQKMNNKILNLENQKKNLENENKLKINDYEKIKNDYEKIKNDFLKNSNEIIQIKKENAKNIKIINELKEKINKANSKIKKYELEKNLDNLDAINLKGSQIDNMQNTINEKDLLIQKLKYNLENDKKTLENDIKELKETNNLLLQENKELKQSKVLLIESTNEKAKINQSLNEYIQKVKILEGQLEEKKKNASVNFLFEEENIRIKSENEKLKLKIKDSENENILIKAENNKLKKKIENMNKEETVKNLTQNNSYCEEEYNIKDLAKIANNLNNSEDMRIDYPGLNNIKNEFEELKKKFEELKELVKYIIPHTECNDPDVKQKTEKVCQILEISLD